MLYRFLVLVALGLCYKLFYAGNYANARISTVTKITRAGVLTPTDATSATKCGRHKLVKRPPTPPSGEIEDITEEMIEVHRKFTESHGLPVFRANETMQRQALNWCEIQTRANCDLIYPLNEALNAAMVPAFMTSENVVQLWYNERSNYDLQKSLIDNIKKAQIGNYEIIHYANIAADYPERGLGCCRAPCKNGICFVYGCAYGPHGVGFWTLDYGENTGSDNERLKLSSKNRPATGYTLFLPEGVKDQIIPPPTTNLIIRIPREELMTTGCSSNVAGIGPKNVVLPWIYSCHNDSVSKNNTSNSMSQDKLNWREERQFLFTMKPFVTADCDGVSLPVSPPALLLCPISCTTTAIIEHKKLQDTATDDVSSDTLEHFKVHDIGQTLCGKAALSGALSAPGGLVEVIHGDSGGIAYNTKGFLSRSRCSATHYSFFDCAANRLPCLAEIRTPSNSHPWIAAETQTSGTDDIDKLLLILRDTYCTSGKFTVNLNKITHGSSIGRLGVFANYLNPGNFVCLSLDLSTGVALLIECASGKCKHVSRFYIGNTTDRILSVTLVTDESESAVTAFVDEEKIAEIEKGNYVGAHIGFFGLSIPVNFNLKVFDDITLTPITKESEKHDDTLSSNSFLPLWPVDGMTEETLLTFL